mgnify:CR=1 FL=1
MKFVLYLLCFFLVQFTYSQFKDLEPGQTTTKASSAKINGKEIDYKVTTGNQALFEDKKPIASIHYTYYKKDETNLQERPLLISFNGGPGSASLWMHLAYTGPKILSITDEGFPVQPYGIKDNPHSILDIADILYVNPVNTGYSRAFKNDKGKVDRDKFYGVQADINYLAEWVNLFISRHNRWLSPKFLIGESYGTTRVSGLALALQNQQWTYLNGVVLVSPTNLGIDRDGPVSAGNKLPYFTAAAWYHKQLPDNLQKLSLEEVLELAEKFTENKLIPSLLVGSSLNESKKMKLAQEYSKYCGLTTEEILQNNMNVPYNYFWKNLLKNEEFTVGRLDSRYRGIDKKVAGVRPDYNAELTSWLHAFTPAANYYFQDYLGLETDLQYKVFGSVRPWKRENDNTGEMLRQAMAVNKNLHVMVQSGYYDGATTYYNAKYTLRHLDHSGKLQNRLDLKLYKSGHMMYLRSEDLQTANNDLRNFIADALKASKRAAKY